MELENQSIKCNTFSDAEAVIKKTETKIKEGGTVKERQYYAQDILLEVETLLSCLSYNSRNPDCLTCHTILRRYLHEYKHLAMDETKEKQHH